MHLSFCRTALAVAVACGLAFFMEGTRTQASDAKKSSESQAASATAAPVKSLRSGPWSDAKTWDASKLPGAGSHVIITAGTTVIYDIESEVAIREVQVNGKLTFARDRNTHLIVGLLRVTPQRSAGETGVEDIDGHDHAEKHGDKHSDEHSAEHSDEHGDISEDDVNAPALEVGTAAEPMPAKFTARIDLKYFEGMDREKLPAILCRPGARMDFHGAPMNRTWVKLGASLKKGDDVVTLSEAVTGWRTGDRVVITGSVRRSKEGKREAHDPYESYTRIDPTSEERIIKTIDGQRITLDSPLIETHYGEGQFRSEIANLSRNVIIQSADAGGKNPSALRGHTMYHHGSLGSISYALFKNLGKENVLGRYPIHFHSVSDTMRGSSVIGAAIVGSHNRWVTVHGSQYLVVRDCVGYQSVGHGFFLEDGTEVYNVLDRNLGIQSTQGKRMKNQALPFDPNEGAAFWWANGRNTFVRNVACENNEYGYRYDSQGSRSFSAVMLIRQPDGSESKVDIRTIPHYRFQHNESHTEGLYAFVFAGTNGVGPDTKHPHVLRDLTLWESHYSLRSQIPTMLVENLRIDRAAYGIYRPWFDNHVYRNIHMSRMSTEPFNRGQDDDSDQAGSITVDGLTFSSIGYGGAMPLIQMSDNNLSGKAESHFRNVKVEGEIRENRWPLVNRGGGAVVKPRTEKGVPIYLHDYYGQGQHAKVMMTDAPDLGADKLDYRKEAPLTGAHAVVAHVSDVAFPKLLDPIDDQPPATAINYPARGVPVFIKDGKLIIGGTTTDNEKTKRVFVNGIEAKDVDYNFHQWEVTLENVKPGKLIIKAHAEDVSGNVEQTPHEMIIVVQE